MSTLSEQTVRLGAAPGTRVEDAALEARRAAGAGDGRAGGDAGRGAAAEGPPEPGDAPADPPVPAFRPGADAAAVRRPARP